MAWGATAALAAVLAGTWVATREAGDALSACRGGQVAGGDIGGPFTLVDTAGREVTDATVLDRPALLYFGYASCPDVCPLDMLRNAQATDILAERGIEAVPVFVTVDPARDTPEAVGAFVANFSDGAVGLTGSDEQVAAAARAWRVAYEAQPPEPSGFYEVSHTVFTYLVLPGIGFVDIARRDETPEAVAERLGCFVEAVA